MISSRFNQENQNFLRTPGPSFKQASSQAHTGKGAKSRGIALTPLKASTTPILPPKSQRKPTPGLALKPKNVNSTSTSTSTNFPKTPLPQTKGKKSSKDVESQGGENNYKSHNLLPSIFSPSQKPKFELVVKDLPQHLLKTPDPKMMRRVTEVEMEIEEKEEEEVKESEVEKKLREMIEEEQRGDVEPEYMAPEGGMQVPTEYFDPLPFMDDIESADSDSGIFSCPKLPTHFLDSFPMRFRNSFSAWNSKREREDEGELDIERMEFEDLPSEELVKPSSYTSSFLSLPQMQIKKLLHIPAPKPPKPRSRSLKLTTKRPVISRPQAMKPQVNPGYGISRPRTAMGGEERRRANASAGGGGGVKRPGTSMDTKRTVAPEIRVMPPSMTFPTTTTTATVATVPINANSIKEKKEKEKVEEDGTWDWDWDWGLKLQEGEGVVMIGEEEEEGFKI